jgi:hypothetical protein
MLCEGAALPDDRLKGPDSNFSMVWHRHGHCPKIVLLLQDDMATTLANDPKTMLLEDLAHLPSR